MSQRKRCCGSWLTSWLTSWVANHTARWNAIAHLSVCVVAVSSLLASATGRAEETTIVIDDFTQGPIEMNLGLPHLAPEQHLFVGGIDDSSTRGGVREIFGSGAAPFLDYALQIAFVEENGEMVNRIGASHAESPVQRAGIRWGSANPQNSSLGDLEWDEVSSGSFHLAVASSEAQNSELDAMQVTLMLTSNREREGESQQQVVKEFGVGENLALAWDIGEFSEIDFSNLDEIELSFYRDFHSTTLDSMTFVGVVVPEPDVGCWFLFMVLGIKASSRRKRFSGHE